MKLKIYLSIFAFILFSFSFPANSQTITDYDGNMYQTVTIGNQTWMAENLRVIHYSDGTPLINGNGVGGLDAQDTTRYYFYYNDNSGFAEEYGCLYTWFAAMNRTEGSSANPCNIQGVCPSGWHIPGDAEWQELEVFLGMDSAIAYSTMCLASERTGNFGDLLKVGGSSGFEAKYAGVRDIDDTGANYFGLGEHAEFISSYGEGAIAENNPVDSYTRLYYVLTGYSELFCHYHGTTAGYSVRCVKDKNLTYARPVVEKTINISVYPNPLKHEAIIKISLKKPETVKIQLFDQMGEVVETLLNAFLPEGENDITWITKEVKNGLYLLRFQAGESYVQLKIIIDH
jgi:uncharacterized protein (TIGR02145 family)